MNRTFMMIPVLLVLALGGGLAWQYSRTTALEAELAGLRQAQQAASESSEALRAEQAELESLRLQAEELPRLRRDSQELIRLRNEVRQLRDSKGEFQQHLDATGEENEQLRAIAQQLRQLAAENEQLRTQLYQAENPSAPPATTSTKDLCARNLRQLDAAIQQWALENQKTATDTVTSEDLMPYLPAGMPACPAGGQYTLSTVRAGPKCSIDGHAIVR